MNDETQLNKLGTAILEPIIKAYKAGGIALALIVAGTAMLISAVIAKSGAVSTIVAIAGSFSIASVVLWFYLVEVKKIKKAIKTVEDNEALLNSIQSTAIQLTEISSHLQALAFKHSDQVKPVIKQIREIVRMVAHIPLLGDTEIGKRIAELADHEKVKEIDELSDSIVEYTESAKEVIEDIRMALTTLNATPLIDYAKQLKAIDMSLIEALKIGAKL
jgi:hypothetical protein